MSVRETRAVGTPCPACRTPKVPRWYLCRSCWGLLPGPTRRALNRRDGRALARLLELHAHIDNGTALTQVEITS